MTFFAFIISFQSFSHNCNHQIFTPLSGVEKPPDPTNMLERIQLDPNVDLLGLLWCDNVWSINTELPMNRSKLITTKDRMALTITSIVNQFPRQITKAGLCQS